MAEIIIFLFALLGMAIAGRNGCKFFHDREDRVIRRDGTHRK